MRLLGFLLSSVGDERDRARVHVPSPPLTRPEPLPFVPATFLGRPATACRFAERRAVIGYVDRIGQASARAVTFDELIDQDERLYLSGYCHERFERRHFRLDRIATLQRIDTGEHVDPDSEVARWITQA